MSPSRHSAGFLLAIVVLAVMLVAGAGGAALAAPPTDQRTIVKYTLEQLPVYERRGPGNFQKKGMTVPMASLPKAGDPTSLGRVDGAYVEVPLGTNQWFSKMDVRVSAPLAQGTVCNGGQLAQSADQQLAAVAGNGKACGGK